jgi:hypothetical protein
VGADAAAARPRPQPASGNDLRTALRQRKSIAAVFGRPPICAYADMDRLKSNEAIPRREFASRDP